MRKHLLTSLVLLPLLLTWSQAAQTAPTDPPSNAWAFSSEDTGGSSYLGVDIADVTTDRLGALKLKEEKGVEVTMVDQDAPAGKAGLKEHDVILTMNGTSVESAAQLRRMIHETPAGRIVTFGLSRDGQAVSVKVQLSDRHNAMAMVGPKAKEFHFEVPEIPQLEIPAFNMVVVTQSGRSGLTLENITPQLSEFFGVKNGNGVLVREVEKGSRADKAGFRAGDVIVKVNERVVHDTSDFTNAVRSKSGSMNVSVVRDRREQNLNLALPERKDSSEMFDEESLNEPIYEAHALELTELKSQMEKIRPELEQAEQQARKAAEEARKSACEMQREMRDASRRQRDELRKQEQELRDQMNRLSHQLRRYSAEL